MQVRAIIEAAIEVQKKGKKVLPEIMIPLVGIVEELKILKARAIATAEECMKKAGVKVEYQIGTMIELPRGLRRGRSDRRGSRVLQLRYNDLTPDDVRLQPRRHQGFMPTYLRDKILPVDPFQTLDAGGVAS